MKPDLESLCGNPVIIGAGLAGLMTALRLAPHPVTLLSKAPLGVEASTPWAQGGLAAALGDDEARLAEKRQVPRDRRPGRIELARQISRGARSGAQQLEDLATRGIGKGAERVVKGA